MQVTEVQVQRSLAALTTEGDAHDGDASSASGPLAAAPAPDEVPIGLVAHLVESPPIRDDRLEEARRRLETGEQPSAEALAQRMVGRLVCDRLR